MSSFLICVGYAAERMLPDVVTALSCGVAKAPEKLDIFVLSSGRFDNAETAELISSLTACRTFLRSHGETGLLSCLFSFSSCVPSFRTQELLAADTDACQLISALRGKGLPLSIMTDREAVEWSFSDLLSRPDDPSIKPFISWVNGITGRNEKGAPQITIVADLSDPFSSGIVLALLSVLKKMAGIPDLRLYLLGIANTGFPIKDTAFPILHESLQAIDSRSLLHETDPYIYDGADAGWLIALPSSFIESEESFRYISVAASRVLGMLYGSRKIPSPGIHTINSEGTVSLFSLDDDASSFVAFLRFSVWAVSDLLPAFRNYMSHPARIHGIAFSQRNAFFRRIATCKPFPESIASMDLMETTLSCLIRNILRFVRSIPAPLRDSPDASALWREAVDACGRYITVASEYDVCAAEAHESGVDTIRPVHRVSLSDTAEEHQLRHLQNIHLQMEEEEKKRDKILASLGGYRSFQAMDYCANRCRTALNNAEKKLSGLPEGTDRLTLLKLERRIRLLHAAVQRCEEELKQASAIAAVSVFPATKPALSDPYVGTFLDPDACRQLENLISEEEKTSSFKLPFLFANIPEKDTRVRLKQLQNLCADNTSSEPVSYLLSKAMDVCLEESASCRFSSPDILPKFPLLPDLFPKSCISRMHNLIDLFPVNKSDDKAECRGLLAMLLLIQYRKQAKDNVTVIRSSLQDSSSPVVRCWLSAQHGDNAFIVSLKKNDTSAPFSVILPGKAFIPARRTSFHIPLIPSFVTWFDPVNNSFMDPCDYMGECDKKLLRKLLDSFTDALGASFLSPLNVFLRSFAQDLCRERSPLFEDPNLITRVCSVCGLSSLPAYKDYFTTVSCDYGSLSGTDLTGSCLTGVENFPACSCSDIPTDILYLFRGIPFARQDSMLLLTGTNASEEIYTLKHLNAECSILAVCSDDFRDSVSENLTSLLRKNQHILPEIREKMDLLLVEYSEPLEKKELSFNWPWDVKSASIQTVLSESVGAQLTKSALNPFSDYLVVFPARNQDIIGDALFSSMCSVAFIDENSSDNSLVSPDAVLPPLSPDFCRDLSTLPEGRTLLTSGLLRFEQKPNGSIQVVLTLDGLFPVRLVRIYGEDEILRMYAHDIPTVAVWPSVPFRSSDWNAYFVFAHLPEDFSLSMLPEDGSYTDVPVTNDNRHAVILDRFPVCLALFRNECSVGSLPNILPRPMIQETSPVEICTDFGSSGTSVIFSISGKRKPMHGPVMVRTLIRNPSSSDSLLRREFLPAVPVSALLPTVTRIFRNTPGSVPEPFSDGIILMSSDLNDLFSTPTDAIYTSLKWEEEKGRSGFLCLHQVLLMAALQARCEGAPSIKWRFSLPDEMAKDGRESLAHLFRVICQNVHQESGYPVPFEEIPVSFASDSSALGAYFRCCAPENTSGGFMILDIGSCTADISLFLRGKEQAVRSCQVHLGIHYMLLPSLLRDPDLPAREIGYCPDEKFRLDLAVLCRVLHAAQSGNASLRKARIAIDYFIADYLQTIISCSMQLYSAGTPSRLAAIILLHLSYLMMLSGLNLLQLDSDSTKNDFLPEVMTICIAGRGSLLMEALPPDLKRTLSHFLSMFRNRHVTSFSMLFSSEKKMEIPVGLSLLRETYSSLPHVAAVPSSIAVRPEALLPEFLLLFRRSFPAYAEILFPGFFTDDFYHPFSDHGESLISSSVSQSFTSLDIPRPYDSLAAWIGNLLDILC